MNAMWQPLMHAQVMKPATPVMFKNHSKTVPPPWLMLRKARRPKAEVNATAAYGTPFLDVFLRKAGADPSSARPRRMREPE